MENHDSPLCGTQFTQCFATFSFSRTCIFFLFVFLFFCLLTFSSCLLFPPLLYHVSILKFDFEISFGKYRHTHTQKVRKWFPRKNSRLNIFNCVHIFQTEGNLWIARRCWCATNGRKIEIVSNRSSGNHISKLLSAHNRRPKFWTPSIDNSMEKLYGAEPKCSANATKTK